MLSSQVHHHLLSIFLLSLLHVLPSFGADKTIRWVPRTDGYAYEMVVTAGDTLTFEYPGEDIDVHLHPSNTCDTTGSTRVGAAGAGIANYTFDESQIYNNVTFACQYWNYCENFGMILQVIVVPEAFRPAAAAASPTDTISPTRLPTRRPTPHPTMPPLMGGDAIPTRYPTLDPTSRPTFRPTFRPTVAGQISDPTPKPTRIPTPPPTPRPTMLGVVSTPPPTDEPTLQPSDEPTLAEVLSFAPTNLTVNTTSGGGGGTNNSTGGGDDDSLLADSSGLSISIGFAAVALGATVLLF